MLCYVISFASITVISTITFVSKGCKLSYPDSQGASQLVHLVFGQSLDLLVLFVEVALKWFVVNL